MNVKFLAVTTLALGAAVFAGNSHAADVDALSSATVITPITIVKATDLAFGSFAPGIGGSVTVDTSGDRAATGAVLSALDATSTAASFTVTGQADATYDITVSDTELSDGTNSMTLTTISDLAGVGGTSGDVTDGLLTLGTQTVYVGGSLQVATDQADGDYAGTVNVEVEYN